MNIPSEKRGLNRRHTFFVYVEKLLDERLPSETGTILTLTSKELAHRLYTILRLRADECVQLFSQRYLITLTLKQSPREKDTIVGYIDHIEVINRPTTSLVLGISLLKKESFEEAVHHATVTGATHIVPLITTKSRSSWLSEREPERLRALMIAACEQSKNRFVPVLYNPILLNSFLQKHTADYRIGFEAASTKTLTDLTVHIKKESYSSIQLFIGPEGGFTEIEVELMVKKDVNFYQLTPTILRSQEAVCLATGIISAINQQETA